MQRHFNEPLPMQLSNAFFIPQSDQCRLSGRRQSRLGLNYDDVCLTRFRIFLCLWFQIDYRQFSLCVSLCWPVRPLSDSWRSDGERRSVRDKNREKDSHHRRCRHRSRRGLLEIFSFHNMSREFLKALIAFFFVIIIIWPLTKISPFYWPQAP